VTDLKKFFEPKSVAVVGASKKPDKLSTAIMRNIINSGYQGTIIPINPKETEIMGYTCYPSIAAIPGDLDLALMVVPAAKVLASVRECGEKGVKNVVVISAGFKEIGEEGQVLERQLVEICNEFDINVMGPNCVGVMDTNTPINASFTAAAPMKGDVAFISQSGAILLAALDWSSTVGLGYSRVISIGNKANTNEIDYIEEVANDPGTKVIMCYVEDITDGPRFLKVAGEAAKKKPVIIYKAGVSQAGAQAASSHTGALAGSDLAYDTAFKQAGIIRAHSMTELFELAIAFTRCPIPAGDRVAIVTNSGGPGIIATDNVELKNLQMARFAESTIQDLRENLPKESNIHNPVDVLGDARTDRYQYALNKVLEDPNVDSVLLMMCPTAVTEPVDTSKAIVEAQKAHPEKPIFTAYMGGPILAEGAGISAANGLPTFTFPETCITCLDGMNRYRKFLGSLERKQAPAQLQVDQAKAKAILEQVAQEGRKNLLGSEASAVAEAYGITVAPIALTGSAEEAVAAAEKMGYPVVLKVASTEILHKSDVGGVKVGLKSADDVRNAYQSIMDSVGRALPDAKVQGIEVQKMMPQGTELIVGMIKDPQFGPLIAFGMGGIYVNLIKDASFRLASSLDDEQVVDEMLAETKAYTLLQGYRGESPRDINAVKDVIKRAARLVSDFPEITEMDINPVFAYENGLSALDIKITIA
jgi:acetyl coenzyme A synthetase (ADP forming)-like protein